MAAKKKPVKKKGALDRKKVSPKKKIKEKARKAVGGVTV